MYRFKRFDLLAAGILILGLTAGGCVPTRLELTESHPARARGRTGAVEPAAILQPDAPRYGPPEEPAAEGEGHQHDSGGAGTPEAGHRHESH